MLRLLVFLETVWRYDGYYHQPGSRWTVREAWFVSGVIVEALRT